MEIGLETSHTQLTEEKLRLLEIQVAGLISDVLMLKAWKSEMTKLHISCKQSDISNIDQGQATDTIMATANVQNATQECSGLQLEAVVPTSDINSEDIVGDTSQKSIQPSESVVPTSDVKQWQAVINILTEGAKHQEPAESSDTSISCILPDSVVPTPDVKQEQILNDKLIKTANEQMVAEENSGARTSEHLDCILFGNPVENAGTEKCENETLDLKCENSILQESTSLSDKDTPADAEGRLSEAGGAAKESKDTSSWVALIEEEEEKEGKVSLPSKCVPPEQEVKHSKTSQLEESVSVQESKEYPVKFSTIGNKHSVLEKLIKSTAEHHVSERGDNTQISNRQDTDNSKVCVPDKQETELYGSDTQHSVASDVRQELQSQDKVEEEDMQDLSVTVKEKKCPTCQCKVATFTNTKDSEEKDSTSAEMVKKMSKEKLQKKYLELENRHQKLLNAICDPSTLTLPDDPHALLNAARDGNIEEAILCTFSPTMMEFRDEDGYAPLHLAVWNDHIKICKLLLAYNMPANVKDNQGNTPLHFAARKGNVEICKVLLEWLAPVNATNTSGTTPLHCAAKEGHAEVFSLLVSKGATVKYGDKWNNTALHMAACNGFLEICKFLVKHGVEINVQNSMGNTPLHNACKAGHFEVVQLLVKNGARLSIKCNKGKTPKEVINSLTHSKLLEWLTKWEKRVCSDLSSILVNFS